MLIVDSQIHIWENETMNTKHRQVRTYSMHDALHEMAQAGVDAALIHPPSTLPKTNATAIAAASARPDKFAILGHFDLADLISDGACERTFDMPKQFRLEQFARNGTAVDRDKWLLAAAAIEVDRTGQ